MARVEGWYLFYPAGSLVRIGTGTCVSGEAARRWGKQFDTCSMPIHACCHL